MVIYQDWRDLLSGETGRSILTRIPGMPLTVQSVQLIADGITKLAAG